MLHNADGCPSHATGTEPVRVSASDLSIHTVSHARATVPGQAVDAATLRGRTYQLAELANLATPLLLQLVHNLELQFVVVGGARNGGTFSGSQGTVEGELAREGSRDQPFLSPLARMDSSCCRRPATDSAWSICAAMTGFFSNISSLARLEPIRYMVRTTKSSFAVGVGQELGSFLLVPLRPVTTSVFIRDAASAFWW